MTGRQSLIRQIQFPKIVLPSAAVLAGTSTSLFGLIALGIVYLLLLRPAHSRGSCFMPFIAAVQLLFTMSVAHPAVRPQRLLPGHPERAPPFPSAVVLPVARACTRSIPSLAANHKSAYTLVTLNPFAILFESYRDITWGLEITSNLTPHWLGLLGLTGFSFLLLLFAVWVFKRSEPSFARIL